MDKEQKLQILDLLQTTQTHLGVEETPEYDGVDFIPIVSDRHTHTDAILALAEDVAHTSTNTTPPISTVSDEIKAD